MRDLTEEELKLAPEWATHYLIGSISDVTYFINPASNKMMLNIGKSEVIDFDRFYREDELRSIHHKPFAISEHELNDHLTELENGSLGVNDSGWIIDKKRAIAIAKALGVTGEDLL